MCEILYENLRVNFSESFLYRYDKTFVLLRDINLRDKIKVVYLFYKYNSRNIVELPPSQCIVSRRDNHEDLRADFSTNSNTIAVSLLRQTRFILLNFIRKILASSLRHAL